MNESKDWSIRSSSDPNILEHINQMHLPNQSRTLKPKTYLEVVAENEVNENIFSSTNFIQSPFPNTQKNQNNLARLNNQLNINRDYEAANTGGIEFAYIESKHCATEASNGSSEHSTINENDHENIQTRIENYNLSPRIRLGNELFAQNHNQPASNRPNGQDVDNIENNINNAMNSINNPQMNVAIFARNQIRRLNQEESLIYQNFFEFYIFILFTYVIIYLIIEGKTTPFAEVVLVWIYSFTQIMNVVKFPFTDDGPFNQGRRKRFVFFDWISIAIYAIGFTLKVGINEYRAVSSILLTPFCSIGALNLVLYALSKTNQKRQTRKKRYALVKRIIFWTQFFLISLKLDNFLNIPWTIIMLVSFVAFAFMIVYSIFPLFILVSTIRMLWRGTLVANRMPNKVKIIGLSWYFVVSLFSTFWTLIIVALARLLENESYTGLIEIATQAALAHGAFIGILTLIFRKPLKSFFRYYIVEEELSRNGLRGPEGPRLEEIVKFETVEPKVSYLLMISPTFHQIWNEEIKNYDQDIKREWRKLIHKMKMSKHLLKKKSSERMERIELIFNKEQNIKKNDTKLNSSVEIVIPKDNLYEEVSENHLAKINYTLDDIDIYDSVKRPCKDGEKKEGENICYICVQRVPDAVFMKCGHSGICYECAMESWRKSEKCVMCRQKVENIMKVKYYDKLKLSKSLHGTKKIRTFHVVGL